MTEEGSEENLVQRGGIANAKASVMDHRKKSVKCEGNHLIRANKFLFNYIAIKKIKTYPKCVQVKFAIIQIIYIQYKFAVIAGRNIKNLRYADDTTFMEESRGTKEPLDKSERE